MFELMLLITGVFVGLFMGHVWGEHSLKRYLVLKAEGCGSKSIKINGKWYVIDKEERP